ncbi:hypothetical protein [Streptomyces sp. AF1A]|jgi:hypothetical protein|uniref:hypothetical protein n=1 Tax=Streptomyces sp. AF1A TaxID=3394350 RepID=UPI0039BD2063
MSTPVWGQQPPVPEPPKKKSKAASCLGAGCLGIVGVLVLGGVMSVAGGKSGDKPAAESRATASSDSGHGAKAAPPSATRKKKPQKKKPQTVTYSVTGTAGADVQYGPAGSSAQGSVPMTVTKPLRDVQYYSITAQLQGGGHVTCRLKVNGKVISQSTASGGYNIATCEISKDLFSGKWTDTNAG